MESFLVVFEDLDVVIGESKRSAPYRGQEQELDVDVPQVAEQQDRNHNRKDDDDTTHCRSAFLLHLAFQPEIPDCLSDLLAL